MRRHSAVVFSQPRSFFRSRLWEVSLPNFTAGELWFISVRCGIESATSKQSCSLNIQGYAFFMSACLWPSFYSVEIGRPIRWPRRLGPSTNRLRSSLLHQRTLRPLPQQVKLKKERKQVKLLKQSSRPIYRGGYNSLRACMPLCCQWLQW